MKSRSRGNSAFGQNKNALMGTLFDHATEGIIQVDENGEMVALNPSAEKMFGYETGELDGEKIEKLIPDRFVPGHAGHRMNYNKNPRSRAMGSNMELFGKRKDNSEFPVEVSLSHFNQDGREMVVAFVVDITIRRNHELSLQKAHQELEFYAEQLKSMNAELEKRVASRTLILEEAIRELERTKEELKAALQKEQELSDLKSRFVSTASHEFRTPLATILSSLSLVARYGAMNEPEKQEKHIHRIRTSVATLTDILDDMLSLSKLEEGGIHLQAELFALASEMGDILRDMEQLAKPGQTIEYQHTGNPEVNFDKKVLRHIILNLLSNAIKFSPEGSCIRVETATGPEGFQLTVKDEGIGIPEEEQKHLFERFFRARNATNIQGTGLGLTIVSRYAEMMGGTIRVESRENGGTAFLINFAAH